LNALDRFVAGSLKALALVRVPTQAQECQRTQTWLRQSLVRDLKMTAGRSRGLALQYGFRMKGDWCGRRNWPKWQRQLPAWFITLITPLHASTIFLHDQIKQLTDQIEAASVQPRPKGMGGLSK
jgi:transposase